MRFQVAFGAVKHMPMINEDGFQIAFAVLPENRLAAVRTPCAHIEDPCEPKVNSIPDASETIAWQDLEQRSIPAQKTRAEALSWFRGSEPIGRLHPGGGIAFCEFTGHDQHAPGRHGKPSRAEQLRSQALIEHQVWALKIVAELDDV